MSDSTVKWLVRVPEDLAERADARVRETGLSRNEWVKRVLIWALDQPMGRTAQPLPGGTVQVVSTHRTDGKWSDPPKEALGGATQIPPMHPANPVSKPFDKDCSKVAFHFEGKRCRWCGGDHV